MRKAYIILAHKLPAQVARLISRLDDGYSSFYLHIDQRSNIADFERCIHFNEKVRKVGRVRTGWATFGIVQATLNAMEMINAEGGVRRIILLSGQDYPIRSNEKINHFFENAQASVFMEYFPVPNHNKWQPNGGMYRVNRYFFGMPALNRYAAKAVNFISLLLPPLQRKLPANITCYGGSQWWTINMRTLRTILRLTAQRPEFRKFMRYAFAPDELFFQTVLLNAPARDLGGIENDNRMFMKWRSQSAGHPEVLSARDFEEMMNSSALFARKFDMEKHGDILDMIDKQCIADEKVF